MSTTAATVALAALGVAAFGTGAQPVISAPAVHPADTQPGSQARPDEAPSSLFARPHPALAAISSVRSVTRAEEPATYSVKTGDTLSAISGTYCGDPGKYPHLASASNIGNPNLIYPHQVVKLACDAALKAIYSQPASAPSAPDNDDNGGSAPQHQSAPVQQAQPQVHVTGLSGTLDCAGLEALWEAANGPAYAAPMAASVAEDESGGQQYAENPSGASGYWQILGQVVVFGDVFNPMDNAENAVAKWRAEGDSFSPAWTTAGMAAADPRC